MNLHAKEPRAFTLTKEDIALLADGTGNIPDATATRLKALIVCDDFSQIQMYWRDRIVPCLRELSQMARDAQVEHLADGLYVFRSLERLRSAPWKQPADVLDPWLDVPYHELILMASSLAERAEADEKVELEKLVESLMAALAADIRSADFVESLIERMLEIGEAAAEAALAQVVAQYRQRREAVGD